MQILNRSILSPNAAVYSGVARTLHWLMAALITCTSALGLLVDDFPRSWEHPVVEIHKIIGISILLLVIVRFTWRLNHRPPAEIKTDVTLDLLARIAHGALYALMVGVPVIGLAYAALRGEGVDFGIFVLPPVMEGNRAAARPFREYHELAAYALIGLASLHAVAALWHHFVRKDGVLRRRLPGLGDQGRGWIVIGTGGLTRRRRYCRR